MKNTIAGAVACLLLVACGSPSSTDEYAPTAQAKAEPGIFDTPYLMRDLDNVLRVIIVRTDYPDIVTVHIPVQTGSRNEVEPGKSGLAHLTDGQSRQLGYAMDSQYYATDKFADYVRDGLNNLTLADVNRVMRENLNTDNMQYVFVTRDAEDLKQRLVGDQASPMVYEAEKPDELIQEDRQIEAIGLGFDFEDVSVVSSEDVFH